MDTTENQHLTFHKVGENVTKIQKRIQKLCGKGTQKLNFI